MKKIEGRLRTGLQWFRLPQVLLAIATFVAVSVSALSDIPETVPFGHELGIVATNVGYAYMGAYIFNWLLVERPRAEALGRSYLAVWRSIGIVATNAEELIKDLEFLADQKESSPTTPDYVQSLMRRIGTGDLLHPPQISARDLIEDRIKVHQEAYKQLEPLLATLESDVIAALATVDSADFFFLMVDVPYERGKGILVHQVGAPPELMTMEGYFTVVYQYWLRSSQLQDVLETSRYTPSKPLLHTVMLLLHKVNWDAMHGRPRLPESVETTTAVTSSAHHDEA